MNLLAHHPGLVSPAFGILRQEVDSMVRAIFLLTVSSLPEREAYATATLAGEQWVTTTVNGKQRKVTDREMVDLAQTLHGWTESVYRFGCSFIHLSNFHNHLATNPFQSLLPAERSSILAHLRNYHGGPAEDDPSMDTIASYVPRVFEKISSNLGYYLSQLEAGGTSPP